ncbi:SH3 domain-containing protein [Sphingomonas baiyangensis]|uniref:SH3 domain-containing protein n=1 Tax=Sphingomonas baiyangensis TaxID=2572576 RepID=A0A4V5PW70_9SPHN|nr:SH3 domain-containing protein [Sphingomonas baiyangensis]TKD50478.1 SH3 domain-containing protein [Sphingomonas baiyangensis]
MARKAGGTIGLVAAAALLASAATPAHAQKKGKKDAEVALATCPASLGTIAVVDGDTQGWTKYGLGSPRGLIVAMAQQSGCFTLHDAASGKPADFLVNAIAGDKEEIDEAVNMAKSAVMQGALQSGALSAVSRVPMLGSVMGMFGGFGGKKKTVAAGLRVLNPATGQTVVAGSGTASKSTFSFGNAGLPVGVMANNAYAAAARQQIAANGYGEYVGYTESKDGKLLASAFAMAFNEIVGQSAALAAVRPQPAAAPATAATPAGK